MQTTKIPWCDMAWNPTSGCTKVGPGCLNCYAERTARRLKAMGSPSYRNGFEVTLHPHKLDEPLRCKKPRIIFVNSMSDLFHAKVPAAFIGKVFGVMEQAGQHTFVVLTKRGKRMSSILKGSAALPNVYLGVSVSTQADVDRDLPHLETVAMAGWKTIVSVEPLLEAVDLYEHLCYSNGVIVGCESGPGRRECKFKWVRGVVQQCENACVPCFVKQLAKHGTGGKVLTDPNDESWPVSMRDVRRLPWAEGSISK